MEEFGAPSARNAVAAPGRGGAGRPAECRDRVEMTLDVTSAAGSGCGRGVFVVTLSWRSLRDDYSNRIVCGNAEHHRGATRSFPRARVEILLSGCTQRWVQVATPESACDPSVREMR